MNQIKNNKLSSSKKTGKSDLGLHAIPVLEKDAGDRNRTSPFAFTGNRFEFRAVGSLQSIANPLVVLNTTLADSLKYITDQIRAKGVDSLGKILQEIIKEHHNVIFNGDGYSEAWHKEAAKRGLKNLRTTPGGNCRNIKVADAVKLFKEYKVLSKVELESRYEVYTEQYVMKINVESNLVLHMSNTLILPSALRYQTELADNVATLRSVNCEADTSTLDEISSLIKKLKSDVIKLKACKGKEFKSLQKEAEYACNTILPLLQGIRSSVDSLEALVADDLWPLPSYQEHAFY